MIKFDFCRYFRYHLLFLRITGCWLNIRKISTHYWFAVFYSITINSIFLLSPQICHVVYMYHSRNNVVDFANEFYISITSLLIVLKAYNFQIYFESIKKMLKDMNKSKFQPSNNIKIDQLKRILNQWFNIFIVYMFLCTGYSCILGGRPFLVSERALPLVDCYPFDVLKSPVYELMLFYQYGVIATMCMQNIFLDTSLTWLICFIGTECDLLSTDLRNIKMDENQPRQIEEKRMEKELNRCIQRYNELYELKKCNNLI